MRWVGRAGTAWPGELTGSQPRLPAAEARPRPTAQEGRRRTLQPTPDRCRDSLLTTIRQLPDSYTPKRLWDRPWGRLQSRYRTSSGRRGQYPSTSRTRQLLAHRSPGTPGGYADASQPRLGAANVGAATRATAPNSRYSAGLRSHTTGVIWPLAVSVPWASALRIGASSSSQAAVTSPPT